MGCGYFSLFWVPGNLFLSSLLPCCSLLPHNPNLQKKIHPPPHFLSISYAFLHFNVYLKENFILKVWRLLFCYGSAPRSITWEETLHFTESEDLCARMLNKYLASIKMLWSLDGLLPRKILDPPQDSKDMFLYKEFQDNSEKKFFLFKIWICHNASFVYKKKSN